MRRGSETPQPCTMLGYTRAAICPRSNSVQSSRPMEPGAAEEPVRPIGAGHTRVRVPGPHGTPRGDRTRQRQSSRTPGILGAREVEIPAPLHSTDTSNANKLPSSSHRSHTSQELGSRRGAGQPQTSRNRRGREDERRKSDVQQDHCRSRNQRKPSAPFALKRSLDGPNSNPHGAHPALDGARASEGGM